MTEPAYQMTWDEAAAIAVRHARKNDGVRPMGADAYVIDRQNKERRVELDRTTTTTKQQMIEDHMTYTDLQALKTLDTLAKSATADHREVTKRLEDLMETRVDAIQKSRNCNRSQAYAQASRSDQIFKSAYKLSLDSQDQATQRQAMSDGLGAHM